MKHFVPFVVLLFCVVSAEGEESEDPSVTKSGKEVGKNRGPCAGCPMDAKVEDDKIKDIATFAFNEYYSSLDRTTHSKLPERARMFIRLVKAQTQIVAGVKYILEVEGGISKCSREELLIKPASECVLDPSHPSFKCNFQVWEQAWLKRKELLQTSKCHEENVNN